MASPPHRSLGARLIFAALTASAAAGFLVTFFMLFVSIVEAGRGLGQTLVIIPFLVLFSLLIGGAAIVPAILYMTIPTFLGGGMLWTVGEKRTWARRRWAFALLGLVFGCAAYAILVLTGTMDIFDDAGAFRFSYGGVLFAFAVAGAGSGLIFRMTMNLAGKLFGNVED